MHIYITTYNTVALLVVSLSLCHCVGTRARVYTTTQHDTRKLVLAGFELLSCARLCVCVCMCSC